MRKNTLIIAFLLFIFSPIFSQKTNDIISSGPMLGYNEMREVMIWIQTKNETDVFLNYWKSNNKEEKFKTKVVSTKSENAFTAHFQCYLLEPGTTYEYEVYANNMLLQYSYPLNFTTQSLWQYRTEAPDFTFALGSCAFISEEKYDRPGEPYGGDHHIFESIADKDPDLMLWMGDNIYLREVDFMTESGFNYRYTHTRATPEMQRLLATTHHYAIWDDHDYGPNNANSSFIHKDFALKSFNRFWANPPAQIDGVKGNTTQFQYNDVDYFLLDNRFYRTEPGTKGVKETMLGKKQINWLISALERSHAHYKFVVLGSPFLNSRAEWENYANYEEEQKEILESIAKNKIEGVIFLTGDKHSSELNKLTLENGIEVYDFTVSPFTSKTYDNCDPENKNRVDGTCYSQRNFATIDVTGTRQERKLTLNLFDTEGKGVWKYEIDYNYKLQKLK